jgi:sugar/nucleoside kinase (ribokinase family)
MAECRAALVIGDIFMDYLSDLAYTGDTVQLNSLSSGLNVVGQVESKIGGAGLQFAVAAKCVGFDVVGLIAKLGGTLRGQGNLVPDEDAARVLSYLGREGVTPHFAFDPALGTGRAILVYIPGDRRLMISDPRANTSLSVSDLTDGMRDAARTADLLHVSGYALLQPNRRATCVELMREARERGHALVALDLVPHDIDRHCDAQSLLLDLRGLVDVLFVELPTAFRILNGRTYLPELLPSEDKLVEQLIGVAPTIVLQAHPSLSKIFGRDRRDVQHEYRPGLSSRGQSARAQASIALGLLPRTP